VGKCVREEGVGRSSFGWVQCGLTGRRDRRDGTLPDDGQRGGGGAIEMGLCPCGGRRDESSVQTPPPLKDGEENGAKPTGRLLSLTSRCELLLEGALPYRFTAAAVPRPGVVSGSPAEKARPRAASTRPRHGGPRRRSREFSPAHVAHQPLALAAQEHGEEKRIYDCASTTLRLRPLSRSPLLDPSHFQPPRSGAMSPRRHESV